MKCQVEYCIYNRASECMLETTEINYYGMCEECIIVSLDKGFLEMEKERQLRVIEERWTKRMRT